MTAGLLRACSHSKLHSEWLQSPYTSRLPGTHFIQQGHQLVSTIQMPEVHGDVSFRLLQKVFPLFYRKPTVGGGGISVSKSINSARHGSSELTTPSVLEAEVERLPRDWEGDRPTAGCFERAGSSWACVCGGGQSALALQFQYCVKVRTQGHFVVCFGALCFAYWRGSVGDSTQSWEQVKQTPQKILLNKNSKLDVVAQACVPNTLSPSSLDYI